MPKKKKVEEESDNPSETTANEEVPVNEEATEVEETTTESVDTDEDFLPAKRVIRRKKSKREKEHPLASAIRLAVESGKVDFGSRSALKNKAKVKLFVFALNTPAPLKKQITEYSKTKDVPTIEFEGNVLELGSVCGKPFSVSVLSVYDVGASTIMSLVQKVKK